jgi:hypothetical protein
MSRVYLPHSWDYRSSNVDNATKTFLSPAQLSNHAVARARMSLIAGVDLALLQANKIILPGVIVAKGGAKHQDDSGNRNERTCAAHALPCGIRINGMTPDHLPALQGSAKTRAFVIEPYRHTNIVPISVNAADFQAEAYRRGDGTGLVANFVDFCHAALSSGESSSGKLNRSGLQAAFAKLIRKSEESFEIALSKAVPATPSFKLETIAPYTDRDFHEDNIRTALRAQARTLKDMGPSLFSPMLVEQVESDFHSLKEEST